MSVIYIVSRWMDILVISAHGSITVAADGLVTMMFDRMSS